MTESQSRLPRMRLAQECYQMIHEEDPDSRVSMSYIRRLSKSGLIPVAKAGNRILINYDSLLEFLANPQPLPDASMQTGMIRPVSLR